MPYLAELRHAKGPPSPRACGSIAASGTRTSSRRMEPVIEARRESLPGQGFRGRVGMGLGLGSGLELGLGLGVSESLPGMGGVASAPGCRAWCVRFRVRGRARVRVSLAQQG